jgi:cysteinyl-tRNA synthetase
MAPDLLGALCEATFNFRNEMDADVATLMLFLSPPIILMKEKFTLFLEDIFGLKSIDASSNEILQPVMELLLEIRKEAKTNKDFATSDKIRNQLTAMGIAIKDEKDGNTSWNII